MSPYVSLVQAYGLNEICEPAYLAMALNDAKTPSMNGER